MAQLTNPTWTPIQTYTVSNSIVTFNNIPQTYTDLVLVASNVQVGTNGYAVGVQYNGDNSNIYSFTALNGTGSFSGSWRNTNSSGWNNTLNTSAGYSNSNNNGYFTIHFFNYSSSIMNKTAISRGSGASAGSDAIAGIWNSVNPITRIDLALQTSGAATISGTFTLYGISANPASSAYATGGSIYQDSTYFYHAFTGSGTFTPKQALTADILVIAGGGGAGLYWGAGGGAGGLLELTGQSLTSATPYTIIVGSGAPGRSSNGQGYNGGNSQFGALTTALGGGGGGGYGGAGAAGGSGGGGSQGGGAGAGTSGQGNAGYSFGISNRAGGGGGAGAASTSDTGGIGKTDAFINDIGAATGFGQYSGGNWYFAGGGGGAPAPGTYGVGGLGGGGSTGNGAINMGGGGGSDGAGGGSGIVIVRYAK